MEVIYLAKYTRTFKKVLKLSTTVLKFRLIFMIFDLSLVSPNKNIIWKKVDTFKMRNESIKSRVGGINSIIHEVEPAICNGHVPCPWGWRSGEGRVGSWTQGVGVAGANS